MSKSEDSNAKKHNNSSVTDDWDNYMNAKKLKLEVQFKSEAEISDTKSNIFRGTSIFVNGYTIPSADELRQLMIDYGGVYHHYYINGKTTYMIASNLPNVKVQHYKNSSTKILKPSWITDSIKAGKMLNFRPYLLLSDFLKNQTRIYVQSNDMKEQDDSSLDSYVDANKSDLIKCDRNMPSTSAVSNSDYSIDTHFSSTVPIDKKTASDDNFLEEFYNNSRLHLISTLGATFKQYVNELRLKNIDTYPGRERLKTWKMKNISPEEYHPVHSCIMHIDMDCFFVSVSLRNRPDLQNLPVVVTHAKGNKIAHKNPENRRAEFDLYEKRLLNKYKDVNDYKPWFADIGESDSMSEIASCNYEARKSGVKNGMLLGQAFKLCPTLRTIPYDFDGYKEVSYALYNHIASYTLDVEAVSCDEMFVDCSSVLAYAKVNVLEFATFLRDEIKEVTGCTCSTGFGPNKLIARLATKKAKPNGQFYVPMENIKTFMQDCNVSDLPGVGRSTSTKLAGMYVKTCTDLQNISVPQLQKEFGVKMGLILHRHSFGEDDRPLNFHHLRKSVSAEVNYGIRFKSMDEARSFLKTLSFEVTNRLVAVGMKGKSITLKLMIRDEHAPEETAKFLGHGICDFVTKTVSLPNATADSEVIFRETFRILQNLKVNPSDMRGIGIQISRLEPKKNTSSACGRIDSFIVKKSKPVELPNGNEISECVSKDEDGLVSLHTESINTSNNVTNYKNTDLKTFDESDYNVSISQIDPNYLAALPSDIREEVVTNLKKSRRSKRECLLTDSFKNGETFNMKFILQENGFPKINPLVPSTEIIGAITEWVLKEKVPQDCDIRMLFDYLQQLVLNKEFESANFILDKFQKLTCDDERIIWKNAYEYVTKKVKETVKLDYCGAFENEK